MFENLSYHKYRLFHSNITLQRALDFTPDYVNYLNGKSYKSIPYKIIPRFIYKNKPVEEWGNFFGKFYKIINLNDFVTSWNYPVLSEFYSNYGFKGIILGMFILGLFIKILVLITQFFTNSILLSSMGYVVLFNLVFQESNLSMLVGKVVNQILFFVCIIISIIIFHYFITKIKMKIKASIIVSGKFHSFYLAEQLQKTNSLHSLITSYPSFLVKKNNISKNKIISLPLKK